jgi:hypothetical protein
LTPNSVLSSCATAAEQPDSSIEWKLSLGWGYDTAWSESDQFPIRFVGASSCRPPSEMPQVVVMVLSLDELPFSELKRASRAAADAGLVCLAALVQISPAENGCAPCLRSTSLIIGALTKYETENHASHIGSSVLAFAC